LFGSGGDGRRLLTARPDEEVGGRVDSQAAVVQNWVAAFKGKD
jgi:hypothetical protein